MRSLYIAGEFASRPEKMQVLNEYDIEQSAILLNRLVFVSTVCFYSIFYPKTGFHLQEKCSN